MSVAFLTAAFAARTGKSTIKSVLIAVADRADDKTGFCWPSVADIVERTELNRKTVLVCLKKLEEMKFISDTGKRFGATNQIKMWRLDLKLIQEASQKRDGCQEASQKRNCSVFPVKESRFSTGRVPKTGHGTTNEPPLNKTTTNQVVVEDIDDIIEAAVWAFTKGGTTIRKLSGFQHKVRSRVTCSGPSIEDLQNLKEWRANQSARVTKAENIENLVLAKSAYYQEDPEATERGKQLFSNIHARKSVKNT